MKQKYAVNKINIVVDTVKMVNYDLIIIETILNDKKRWGEWIAAGVLPYSFRSSPELRQVESF
jgi:hypothetical protein